MKAHQIIADSFREWRPQIDAPKWAQQHAHLLDDEETERLVIQGLAAEFRKTLTARGKDGLPVYSCVDDIDAATGKKVQRYKQTALFDLEDFGVAIASYVKRSQANRSIAVALVAACKERFDVQLDLDWTESA